MVRGPNAAAGRGVRLLPWALDNHTPFEAERAFCRDPDGSERFVVAVRGTFDVLPDGLARPSATQKPVRVAPVHAGEPGRSELLLDSDLVPGKPTTDVLVRGQAHAPGGRPVRSVRVELRLPGVVKALRVVGEERFAAGDANPVPRRPAPFVAVPVTWERAFGGARAPDDGPPEVSAYNPVGRGAFPRPGDPKPQVFAADGDALRAVGLGAVDRAWEPRRSLARGLAAPAGADTFPLPAAPADPAFFLCSPQDQRPPTHLAGGEIVTLAGLTPSGRWQVRVPEIQLELVSRLGGRCVALDALLHTLVLEPERSRVEVVWHASLRCPDGPQHLGVTTITALEVLP